MDDLISVKIEGWKQRAGLLAAVLVFIIVGWVAISAQVGDMIAELTPASSVNAEEVSLFAQTLAPRDPRANGLVAEASSNPAKAVEYFEGTVRLAPSDHRWRVALGRAYEQSDRIEEGAAEFLQAVALAPEYAYTHWHLGNFYLRQERESEAVEALKKATTDHYGFREQVFSLAWDYFGRDASQMERVAAENAEVMAYLAKFLASKGNGDRSLEVWNRLTQDEKESYREVGLWAIRELVAKNAFVEAQEILRQLGATNAQPERITNPSFEEPLKEGDAARFGWELTPGEPRVELSPDSREKHSGNRSFRITFRNYAKPNFADLFQTVVVKPDRDYVLRFRIRTEGLAGIGAPVIQIANMADNASLAVSDVFPPDTSDWNLVRVPFRSPANSSAISIRTIRSFCGENCPITGTLWYDDFELTEGK